MVPAELISTYGYAAVGIGAFLEGETFLVLGGFAAHSGYLELPWVIASAFTGAIFGDQLYFYLGRLQGKAILERRPNWKIKSEKVFARLERNQVWFILGFRFLYGLRVITPFIIGMSNISRSRFLALNIIGTTIWATSITVLGYLFGNVLEAVFGNIKKYEISVLVVLALAGLVAWFIRSRRKSSN